MLTAERARELFTYDQETGVITWRKQHGSRRPGMVAGKIRRKDGYVQIGCDLGYYLGHRIAWVWMTGNWPSEQIDHINGQRADNRWANLREVTRAENNQNLRNATSLNRSSGLLGVTKHKNGKWQAGIKLHGKSYHLGLFLDREDAHEAYVLAKRQIHPKGTL